MNYSYQTIYHDEVDIFGILKDCVWIVIKAIIYGLVIFIASALMFGYNPYLVVSGSMSPTLIENKDIVLVKAQDFQDYKVDDIITFYTGSKPCTHRVYSLITEDGKTVGIKTRGDAQAYHDPNAQPDSWTVRESGDYAIIGKVVAIYKNVGAVYLYIQNNLFLCAGMILLLYMGSVLLEKEKEYEKKPVIGL